jgi:hypothetical protein
MSYSIFHISYHHNTLVYVPLIPSPVSVLISHFQLTNSMRLPRLPLQTMFLVAKRITLLPLRKHGRDERRPSPHRILMLAMFLNLLLVQRIQRLQRKLEVGDERVAAGLGKVFAHDDAQHLHFLRVRGHGVGGDDPAAFAELMGTNNQRQSVRR